MSADAERERMARSLREAMADLGRVFQDLAVTAEEKSSLRCPYMTVKRECTAAFTCPNQEWHTPGRRAACSGEHKIDFSRGDPRIAEERTDGRTDDGGTLRKAGRQETEEKRNEGGKEYGKRKWTTEGH